MDIIRKRSKSGVVPDIVREQAVKLHQQGRSQRDIADVLLIDKKTVGSIINSYYETGKFQRPVAPTVVRERKKLSLDTMKAIELYKLEKPSIYLKEIQQKLLHDNVCTNDNLPSIQSICGGLKEIGYTYKKIYSVPSESQTAESQVKYDEYMNYISDIDVHSLHFFDESSVIRTSGKRNYGSSEIGKRAIEIQPYASNATFTINLLHGICGIDCFSILEGPSNGQELLNFFVDALDVRHEYLQHTYLQVKTMHYYIIIFKYRP